MHHYETVVVGLGGMGSAAIYHLARRGVRVLGVERFEIGHDLGSSHGESRVIRLSYFEDARYVPLLRRAYENWEALAAASGEQVLVRTGIVESGPRDSRLIAGTLKASVEHGIRHTEMSPSEVRERFPALELPEGWIGVFQADGGFVRPGLAVRLHVDGARAAGADVVTGRAVVEVEPASTGVRLTLDDGAMIEAGSVVLAAGAWMRALVPGQRPLSLQPTRQVLAWFAPKTPELFRVGRFPVFLFESGLDLLYGFPSLTRWGVKAAIHRPGPPIDDPDAERTPPSVEEVAGIRELLGRFAPQAAGALTKMEACVYTNTPDGHFVIDLHPDDPRIVIASPCSGHGFKFASAIGEILADLATDAMTAHDMSLFSLARAQDA